MRADVGVRREGVASNHLAVPSSVASDLMGEGISGDFHEQIESLGELWWPWHETDDFQEDGNSETIKFSRYCVAPTTVVRVWIGLRLGFAMSTATFCLKYTFNGASCEKGKATRLWIVNATNPRARTLVIQGWNLRVKGVIGMTRKNDIMPIAP